jgi:CRAL/TRIO domain
LLGCGDIAVLHAVGQSNYPEMMGHTCIINAGSIISFLFGIVKPYLDSRTRSKIEVMASWTGLSISRQTDTQPDKQTVGMKRAVRQAK